MLKIKSIALSLITVSFLSLQTSANDASPSPVDFILAETLASPLTQANSKRMRSAAFDNDKRSLFTKYGAALEIEGKNTSKTKEIDHVFLNLEKNMQRYKALEANLIATYGAPKSQRRNLRIWEVANNGGAARQSQNTTIMAGEEDGRYFITIDRRGPNSARLNRTNAAAAAQTTPRVQAQSTGTSQRQIDYSVTD